MSYNLPKNEWDLLIFTSQPKINGVVRCTSILDVPLAFFFLNRSAQFQFRCMVSLSPRSISTVQYQSRGPHSALKCAEAIKRHSGLPWLNKDKIGEQAVQPSNYYFYRIAPTFCRNVKVLEYYSHFQSFFYCPATLGPVS